MKDTFDQEPLLGELSAALARLRDESPEGYDTLGEVVGALAASGEPSVLRYATTTIQRALRADQHGSHQAVLRVLKEALRAAATHHSGTILVERARLSDAGVRERVLAALQGLTSVRSSDLACDLDITVPQASRALRELADQHLVVRAGNGSLDGRARYWRLSPMALAERAPFASVAAMIDNVALDTGLFRNDMLPLGPSDRISGETFRSFQDRLASAAGAGRYRPAPAQLFSVAKDGDTSRPAALLRLPERVVYTALVSTVGPAIAQSVSDAVLWPRGRFERSRWSEFERLPLESNPSHVVVADIASFYDTIDHGVLADSLAAGGADAVTVKTLSTFLAATMQRTVGLPQGLPASDPLATASLVRIDQALQAAGVSFFRHGDDYRFPVSSRLEARRAVSILDEALRESRLHLNTDKTHAVHADDYAKNLADRQSHEHDLLRNIRRTAGFETGEGLLGESEGFDPELDPGVDALGRLGGTDGVVDLAAMFGLEVDIGERAQYSPYGELEAIWYEEPDYEAGLDVSEAVEHILDAAANTAVGLIEQLISGEKRTRWSETSDRRSLSSTLSILALGRRPIADAELWTRYLAERPQDTRVVALYFGHVVRGGDSSIPLAVASAAIKASSSDTQQAWLLSSLGWAQPEELASLQVQLFSTVDDAGWLSRLASASLLQRMGALSSMQLQRLWSDAPLALRPDLVALIGRGERTAEVDQVLTSEADDVERALLTA